jgi:hemerythrin HHE cation binding domain-containing protein
MPASTSDVIGIHTVQTASSTTVRPLAGVFETLSEQHRQALQLLRQAGTPQATGKRQEHWDAARRWLLSHERAEMETVFSALEGYSTADALLKMHTQQAIELESAINQLESTHIDSDDWIERLRDVMALLDDHLRDEENDFFQRAQELLGENTARELDAPFMARQRELLRALE